MERLSAVASHLGQQPLPQQPAAVAAGGSATAPVCTPSPAEGLPSLQHGTVASFPHDFFGYFG
eukprot:COSAG04_NODE_337_length_16405_cov_652.804060_8_plen_63_part_00